MAFVRIVSLILLNLIGQCSIHQQKHIHLPEPLIPRSVHCIVTVKIRMYLTRIQENVPDTSGIFSLFLFPLDVFLTPNLLSWPETTPYET